MTPRNLHYRPEFRAIFLILIALAAGMGTLSAHAARPVPSRPEAPQSPTVPPLRYLGMMTALKAATRASHGQVRVVSLGESVEGRMIPLVAIGSDTAKARVLVLCRQHGDEPVSTRAAVHLITRAATGDPALRLSLRDTLLMIAPMVNPDGAERGTRLNARGADLNRDWRALSQPETRAIRAAYDRLAPQVVLDEHEWTNDDPTPGSNSLEAAHANAVTAAIQQGASDAGREAGLPLRLTVSHAGWDPRLAHRTFSGEGASALLLETKADTPVSARLMLYEKVILKTARVAALHAPGDYAPGSLEDFTALFAAPSPSQPAPKPGFPYAFLGLGALSLALALWRGGARGLRGELRRSTVRRTRLCDILGAAARMERRAHPPLSERRLHARHRAKAPVSAPAALSPFQSSAPFPGSGAPSTTTARSARSSRSTPAGKTALSGRRPSYASVAARPERIIARPAYSGAMRGSGNEGLKRGR